MRLLLQKEFETGPEKEEERSSHNFSGKAMA
jgi:hypothetical protein